MSPERRAVSALAIAAALGVAVTGLLSGCSLMSPAKVDTHKDLLSALPKELPQRKTRTAVLLVFAPDALPVYDTARMAYIVRPFQVDYFSQHEWGETPSQMLQPLLVEALQRTHAFSAVLAPPYAGHVSYSLHTQILELTQDFTGEPAVLRLVLRCELSDDSAGRVIATRDIAQREPMREKTPYGGVVAANQAVAKALQQVAQFVLDETG